MPVESPTGVIYLNEPNYVIKWKGSNPGEFDLFVVKKSSVLSEPRLAKLFRKEVYAFEGFSLDHFGLAACSGLLGPDNVSISKIYSEQARKLGSFENIEYEGIFDQTDGVFKGMYYVQGRGKVSGFFEMRRLSTGNYS